MTYSSVYLVVMAGGSGTRFWPKSTSRMPKQLLSFGKNEQDSLLALTLKRFQNIVPHRPEHQLIVTTQALAPMVKNQIGHQIRVLAEPTGRNTAPCIYWAAREIAKIDPQAVMLVMPSDHFIARQSEFESTLSEAIHWAAQNDHLVTLGVKPTRPETGYGYLKLSRSSAVSGQKAYKVERFIEKPNLKNARQFVSSGDYLWNGGMFLWRAETILKAFDRWMPEIRDIWESSSSEVEQAYPRMPAISIDYGIMEKADNVMTFALDCGWDDLGSWTSLESLADVLQTRQSCGVVNQGEVLALDSGGNIVDAPKRLVALLGVENLIVVEHGGALLIAHKDRAQDIKLLVDQVKKQRPDLV